MMIDSTSTAAAVGGFEAAWRGGLIAVEGGWSVRTTFQGESKGGVICPKANAAVALN
jgi:hypothetical protein